MLKKGIVTVCFISVGCNRFLVSGVKRYKTKYSILSGGHPDLKLWRTDLSIFLLAGMTHTEESFRLIKTLEMLEKYGNVSVHKIRILFMSIEECLVAFSPAFWNDKIIFLLYSAYSWLALCIKLCPLQRMLGEKPLCLLLFMVM